MSTNAAHALKPTPLAPSALHARSLDLGLRGRAALGEGDIHVIAGGRFESVPLHARAVPNPLQPAPRHGLLARLHASMQGVEFDLNAHERAFAFGAGTLFVAIALVTALV